MASGWLHFAINITMSLDGINNTKGRILEILSELEIAEIETIEKWICSKSYEEDLAKKNMLRSSEKPLKRIAESLKKIVPFAAEMLTENIVPPTVGDQADCTKVNTCHVDEFLYDDAQVENLIKKGKLNKYYCNSCGSHDIKELIYISHSMSRPILQYIFKVLLPLDLQHKQILDVGSRLGAVLYGAYFYSNAPKVIGVEINKDLCEIQENIISQYCMDTNRIKIINSDITHREDIVESSNIVIINVLDFFVDVEKHKEMWYFFKKHIKKGTYLISNRSMADTLSSLDMFEECMDWLNICKPCQPENEIYFDVEDYSEIYLYTIN